MLAHPKEVRSISFVVLFIALHIVAVQVTGVYIGVFCLLFSALATMHFAIVHNHVHVPVFKSYVMNRLLDYVLAILLVDAPTNIQILHVHNHHTHSETEMDYTSTHIVPDRWRRWMLFAYPYFIARHVMANKRAIAQQFPDLHRKKQRELTAAVAFLAAYALYFGILKAALYWLIPSLVARWFLLLSNLAHHDGCDPAHRYQSARNFVGSAFNWFYFNSGYHMAHHLRPRVHWSDLPPLHQKMVVPHIDSRFVERDIFSTLWRRFVVGLQPAQIPF